MSNKAQKNYYANKVRDDIEALGLIFDEEAHARAVEVFRPLKITQKQHDALVLHHAKEVYALFDPKGKGLRFRLLMAAHFLGIVAIFRRIKIALRIA